MALQDPSIARTARAERAARRRRTRLFTMVLPLTVLVDAAFTWSVLGLGIGTTLSTGPDVDDLTWQPVVAALSVPAVICLGLALIISLASRIGPAAAVLVRTALLLGVAAVALVLSPREWGDRPAGAAGSEGWWGFASWGPPALAGVSAVLLVGAWLTWRRRRDAQATLQRIAVSGVAAAATVTAADVLAQQLQHGEHGPPIRSLVRVTLRFVDTAGTTRWAELAGHLDVADVPRVGDTVAMRYDGDHPSDAQRMVVSLPWVDRRGGATSAR
ncbi:hypothetical protein [Aeromicrobium endophyticum]|uniref:DUF3592 domain-containing protein n=1 Tax=Aeromicrobium endophyticum TaxID=2292704 RepID=A0A371P8T6_9ACTN|nr:hypothetical protein [Aeromicrobium endophyticum]REK72312.1 hypothetical protein DX116_01340 [Aeromicrobium endophyticum]